MKEGFCILAITKNFTVCLSINNIYSVNDNTNRGWRNVASHRCNHCINIITNHFSWYLNKISLHTVIISVLNLLKTLVLNGLSLSFSNKIGAFITYILIHAMNLRNEHIIRSDETDLDRDALVQEWTKNAVLSIIPFLLVKFKDSNFFRPR